MFGTVDVVIAITIVFLSSLNPPTNILVYLSVIAFTKSSFGMLRDFGSLIDFSAGILLGISIIANIPFVFCVIVGALVFQKGIFSFL